MLAQLPWGLLSVEWVICGWILFMLLADIIAAPARKSVLWIWALAGIVISASILVIQSSAPSAMFQSMLSLDSFSRYFKALFLLTAAVVILMTREFKRHLTDHAGAFYMLLFTALLGMLVLSSISDLLMLFIGLELLTFSLYIMAAYLKADSRSVEAGMKYLIIGSVSTGFLLYGIALLYGFAGSTSFSALRMAIAQGPMPAAAYAGLLLVMAGLGFKIGAVPFHLWVADVYEGAPTPVVALLSVGSKMAGVVALLRVLYGVFLPAIHLWAPIIAVMSAATILYGNLGALPQTNIKRLLGYSSIGHAGYLLMGLATGTAFGAQAVTYYLLAYLFSNMTVFLVVITASDSIGGEELDDYKGLSKRSGFLAAAMFIGLLSLAGVPPLGGFVGKLFVMLAAVENGRLWLVSIGAANVAVSLYYYLMVIKRMYLDAPATQAPIRVDGVTKLLLIALTIGILITGIYQGPFLNRIASAITF